MSLRMPRGQAGANARELILNSYLLFIIKNVGEVVHSRLKSLQEPGASGPK
jgi:hypothetical protein